MFESLNPILTWVGVLVVGAISALGFFTTGARKTRKETDLEEQRLLFLKDETIKEQGLRIAKLQEEMRSLQNQQLQNTKEIGELRGTNQMLTKLLQGRDEQAQRFQAEGLRAFAKQDEHLEVTNRINETLEKLVEAISKLVDLRAVQTINIAPQPANTTVAAK